MRRRWCKKARGFVEAAEAKGKEPMVECAAGLGLETGQARNCLPIQIHQLCDENGLEGIRAGICYQTTSWASLDAPSQPPSCLAPSRSHELQSIALSPSHPCPNTHDESAGSTQPYRGDTHARSLAIALC